MKIFDVVEQFRMVMVARLAEKEVMGYTGWDDDRICPEDGKDGMRTRFGMAVLERRWVDVANFAVMFWYRDLMKSKKERIICGRSIPGSDQD